MSRGNDPVTSPFWSGDLKHVLRAAVEEEHKELAALDRQLRAAMEPAEQAALKELIEETRRRYAARRRHLAVEHGLTLFVGD